MELGLILAIVVLLFGASRLPKLANSLGRSTKEFQRGRNELREELEESSENGAKDE